MRLHSVFIASLILSLTACDPNATGSNTAGNTSGASGSGSNTSGSNTSGSNTSGSNTSGSNTSGSNTSGSNTSGSNTSGSNTSGSNTSGSNTSGSNTSGSNTSGSNTSGSNTSGSNTSGSNTSGSNTSGSNTSGSNTSGSNTSGSNTSGSNTSGSNSSAPWAFLYDVVPNIDNCDAGKLKDSEKQKVLTLMNQMRQQHGLADVSYQSNDDIYTAKSALLGVANADINHFPAQSSACWSQEGRDGSSKSNLYLSLASRVDSASDIASSESQIVTLLIDDKVESLGHRRWMLNPFLTEISFGRVDGKPKVSSSWNYASASSLKINNDTQASSVSVDAGFVAYPYQNYPSDWYDSNWYHSFSVITNQSNIWGNKNVDFSNANVRVTNAAGQDMVVSAIKSDNSGFGVPNNLQWKVTSAVANQKYTVNISNVQVNGVNKSYQYWFNIQ